MTLLSPGGTLTRFQFDNHIAHGAIVEIDGGAEALLTHRDYAADVRQLIAEAMAAMPLLATHLGREGRINLQFQRDGAAVPVKLLVAQIAQQSNGNLTVRGMAKAQADAVGGFEELLGDGVLALMIEPNDPTRMPTQALVNIEGGSLAAALEGYFAQSEQLPTLLRLAADGEKLRGFLLQRLPLEHTEAKQEDWEHLHILASTLGTEELLGADAATLLRRLFASEAYSVYEPRTVGIACRCSESGIGRLLLSLGRAEVGSILVEQQRVAITCEFCGREYIYSPAEAHALFAASEQTPAATKH